MSWGWGWKPYVPVAERRRKAMAKVEKMKKKGQKIMPVTISGRTIASSFWGKSWCENLEAYSDFANRLPRGRTYVRNGSVIDLQIEAGRVNALVSGSDIYKVDIQIQTLRPETWGSIKKECAGRILSLLDLLQGKLSGAVMEIVTRKSAGLFPHPAEIAFNCSCPDWASMCKHVAAVLYGVGARIDQSPELLFLLRKVQHEDLISEGAAAAAISAGTGDTIIAADELTKIFGIDIDIGNAGEGIPEPAPASKKPVKPKKVAVVKTAGDTPEKVKKKPPKKSPAASKKTAAAKKTKVEQASGKAKAATKTIRGKKQISPRPRPAKKSKAGKGTD